MITKITSERDEAQFLSAVGDCPVLQAQLTMRLALFRALPGSGWQFYIAQPAAEDMLEESAQTKPLAVALRGGSATVVGQFDPEELGSFLTFLGIDCLTMPTQNPPEGYAYKQTLSIYTLSAGQRLSVPKLTGEMAGQAVNLHLDSSPSVMCITPLLFPSDAADGGDAQANAELQDQYYADNTLARNAGMAEFWLLLHGEVPVFTLAASAVVGQVAYLSAGETIESYRAQGIGGHYIVKMANEYAAKGYKVCFVCEAVRCHFYNRLGFTKSGELYQYMLNTLENEG